MADQPLYDVEDALLQLDVNRASPNPVTRECISLGDKLAGHLRRHFTSPEEQEIAGRAAVLLAAALGGLAASLDTEEAPRILMNVEAFAGQDLIMRARRG